MNRTVPVRLGLMTALAAALLVAGCGRKGPLDLPPASMSSPPGEAAGAPGGAPSGSASQTGYDEYGQPVAPQGTRRRTPLDWLID